MSVYQSEITLVVEVDANSQGKAEAKLHAMLSEVEEQLRLLLGDHVRSLRVVRSFGLREEQPAA